MCVCLVINRNLYIRLRQWPPMLCVVQHRNLHSFPTTCQGFKPRSEVKSHPIKRSATLVEQVYIYKSRHLYSSFRKMSKSQLIAILVKMVGSTETRVSDIFLVNNISQTTRAISRNSHQRLMNLDATTTTVLHKQQKQWHKNNSATTINR